MALFKTRSGGHVSIYVPWRAAPIEIMEGGTLETFDKAWIEALKGSPECVEVKQAARPVLRDKREALQPRVI